MTKDYWLARWERNEIGFHQDSINPYLLEYWQTLQLDNSSPVFVPLCGKSRDMVWLRNQGHSILGVELSALAIKMFYAENGLTPHLRHTPGDKFGHFSADHIHILHGNFFDLCKDDLVKVSAVYDRASMVALPAETRRHYVTHMLDILPPATQILLISFDYPQADMQGPPYAVSPDEVIALYQNKAEIRLLTHMDVLEENPRFRQRGITRLQESIFLLTLDSPNS